MLTEQPAFALEPSLGRLPSGSRAEPRPGVGLCWVLDHAWARPGQPALGGDLLTLPSNACPCACKYAREKVQLWL